MTTNSVLRTYRERFPWHAHATDNFALYGTRFYDAEEALDRAIVQHNQKHSVAWIVYDMDTPTSSTDWIDKNAPPPNIVAVNPENGHAHYFYGLEIPIHNYIGASLKALRYLAAVDIGLTHLLGADPAYAKFFSKNPFSDKWVVTTPYKDLYTLDSLAVWIDLGVYYDKRKNLEEIGYGRNFKLFNSVRKWAYRERRKEQQYFSYEMFEHACRCHAAAINAELPPPLPNGEVRSTAKSVAKWTWRNMDMAGFKAWQRAQSIKGNKAKTKRSLTLRQTILKTVKQCPEVSQGDIAVMLGISRMTISRHCQAAKKEGVTFPISDREY